MIKYNKYTTEYKNKEKAYFKAGFKRKSVKYQNGCKIITYVNNSKNTLLNVSTQ